MSPAKNRKSKKSSAKSLPPPPVAGAVRWLVGPGRTALLAVLVFGASGALGVVAWRMLDPLVQDDPRYALRVEDVHLTPPPPWVEGEIAREALQSAALDGASVLDEKLGERIAVALEFHPWIESVEGVTKRSGPRIDVEVIYRRPVALVELARRDGYDRMAVDRQGVRLPEPSLDVDDLKKLPTIPATAAAPLVGEPWTEPSVAGAVEIAAVLVDDWTQLQLVKIAASEFRDPTSGQTKFVYTLVTSGGRSILWGHAPNEAADDEMPPDAKRTRLLQYVEQFGSLDAPDDRQSLNLFHATEAQLSKLPTGPFGDREVR